MEELGVTMAADMGAAEAQLNKAGLTFLFAPYFHKSMRNVSGIRKELGFKTVFNILGPLTNPMHARRQVIGSYDKAVAGKLAGACGILGAEKALVVSSDIDEISVSGETQVYEVDNGRIKSYTLNPEDFGFSRCDVAGILAEGRAGSADTIIKVLSGREGPARSVALLNAGAAVYASGEAGSIAHGVTMAERSVDSGMALEKLRLLRDFNGHS
jgi:anthranilate phosphoribosyltransferase